MARLQLVPECHAETTMVSNIFMQDEDVLNHASGIHEVSRILKKEDKEGYINVGFVDTDKYNNPPYFDEFISVEDGGCISLKKHPDTNDYLFFANPAIEVFLITQLQEINKTASEFGLPDNFKEFKRKMKKSLIGTNENYQNLLLELKTQNTSGITFIQKHIDQFRTM